MVFFIVLEVRLSLLINGFHVVLVSIYCSRSWLVCHVLVLLNVVALADSHHFVLEPNRLKSLVTRSTIRPDPLALYLWRSCISLNDTFTKFRLFALGIADSSWDATILTNCLIVGASLLNNRLSRGIMSCQWMKEVWILAIPVSITLDHIFIVTLLLKVLLPLFWVISALGLL